MNKNEQIKVSAELPKLCEIREQESDAQIQNRRSMTERFVDSAPEAPIRSVKYIHKHGISRYNNALHNLIPIRRAQTPPQSKESMSIDNVGLFSFLYSTWLTKYLWAAYRKEIAPSNLPTVSKFDSCAYNVQRLEILWNNELSKQGSEAASFPLVVWRFVRTRVLVSCFLIFCSEVIGFSSNTLIIRRVLEHIDKSEESFWSGLKWVIGLGVLDLIRALLFSWSWLVNYRTAVRLKAACLTLLYRKIINSNTLGGKSAGELINIFSNDGQRVSDVIVYGPMIVGGPIITVCAVICILSWLSPIALLGIVIFLLFYPVQYAISRVFSYCRRKTIKIADTRIERTIEILDCIKLIKLYAWEKHFSDDILRIRDKERSWLWKTACLSSFGSALSPAVPIMSIIVTFLVHLSMGNNLTAAVKNWKPIYGGSVGRTIGRNPMVPTSL